MPNKIDSNLVGLRMAKEVLGSPGVLPGTPVWKPLSPNSYGEFGSDLRTEARNTINAARSVLKGSVVDEEAVAAFQVDLTSDSVYDLLAGFCFASWREKEEQPSNGVAGGLYLIADTSGFAVGDLVVGEGYSNAANNVFGVIATIDPNVSVELTGVTAVTEAASALARLTKVGVQGTSGDIEVDTTSGMSLTSTTLDFTDLGLIPGEWIFVGGDAAGKKFTTAGNNGWKRVLSVTANEIVLDESHATMATEAGGALTIQLFIGNVVKNEDDPDSRVEQTWASERSLGSAGYEYGEGLLPDTLGINISESSKVTLEMGFVALSFTEVETGSRYSGTFPTATRQKIFSASSDMGNIRFRNTTDDAAFFQHVTALRVAIANGAKVLKAVGMVGGFDFSLGDFVVNATADAYFTSIGAVQAVRDNDDAGMDFTLVKQNQGYLIDIPLMTVDPARKKVEKDEPIKLPFSSMGNQSDFGHTLLIQRHRYLPDAAM